MIRHIVAFDFKKSLSVEEKATYASKFIDAIEALKILDEVITINVYPLMDSSTKDICLEAYFKCKEDLDAYSISPLHTKTIGYFSDVIEHRTCLDFEVA